MSYYVPTLKELSERARNAFRSFLPGTDAMLWPNNVTVSAKVIAGKVFEVFGFAAYISKMIFVHTAPDLETLKLHGADFGMELRPARPASGSITLTSGGDDLTIKVGAVFRRLDGVEYVAKQSGSRSGAGTIDIKVDAALGGLTGNAEVGTSVEVVSGVTGEATAEVAEAIIGGADVEDAETFRSRILFRKRNPPHGGAASDYVLWATEVIGVTRVFVERLWAGAGTVRVFVLMDGIYENGIPPSDAIARVTNYIEAVRPAGAIVTVAAPTPKTINVTVTDIVPNTTQQQEEVRAALRDAFFRHSRVAGSNTPFPSMPYLATPQSFSLSWIWQAVADATGEERHKITTPTGDIELENGEVAVLGTVAFATS